MANWSYRKFGNEQAMIDWLNGVMIGTANLHTLGADVDNKTLIIDDGGGNETITFTPTKSRNWTLAEIVAFINAYVGLNDVALIRVVPGYGATAVSDRRLAIYDDPALTIRGNGTANAELGFVEGATPADDTVQSIIVDTTVVKIVPPPNDPNGQWVVIRYA